MKTVYVAAGIIKNGEKILATQRAEGKFAGKWEFPGGKIEAGETPREAVVREIKEELGVEVSAGEAVDTIEYDYPDFHLSMECFWCELLKGEFQLRVHMNAKWVSADELGDMDWLEADKDLIRKIAEMLG